MLNFDSRYDARDWIFKQTTSLKRERPEMLASNEPPPKRQRIDDRTILESASRILSEYPLFAAERDTFKRLIKIAKNMAIEPNTEEEKLFFKILQRPYLTFLVNSPGSLEEKTKVQYESAIFAGHSPFIKQFILRSELNEIVDLDFEYSTLLKVYDFYVYEGKIPKKCALRVLLLADYLGSDKLVMHCYTILKKFISKGDHFNLNFFKNLIEIYTSIEGIFLSQTTLKEDLDNKISLALIDSLKKSKFTYFLEIKEIIKNDLKKGFALKVDEVLLDRDFFNFSDLPINSLSLKNCNTETSCLQIIKTFPQLTVLSLPFKDCFSNTFSNDFPNIKELVLIEPINDEQMLFLPQSLKILHIRSGIKLTTAVLDVFESMSALEELHINSSFLKNEDIEQLIRRRPDLNVYLQNE